jgi:hypothetical protein
MLKEAQDKKGVKVFSGDIIFRVSLQHVLYIRVYETDIVNIVYCVDIVNIVRAEPVT